MIMPGTLSTITAALPPSQRVRGVAIWSGFAAAGAIIGLVGAGALLEAASWRAIFIASAIVALIGGLPSLLLAPNTREEDTGYRYDLVGALTLSLAIGTLVYSIIEGNDRGWTSGPVVAGLGIGLTSSTGTAVIVGSLDRNQQGVASAVNDGTREVGSAIGIALMGSVYGTKYRDSLPDLSQLPARAAGAVRESPASGLHVASGFGPHGDTLAAAVRGAFLHGLAASLIAVAAILAVSAFVAFVPAPHVLPETE